MATPVASTSTSPPSPRTSRTNSIQGRYGFAKLDDDIVLVQLISSPAPRTYEAHVFRHNFVSVFSYSHTQTFGSNLLEVLENDGNNKPRCWLEEETATVFAAQDVMTRYIWLKDRSKPMIGVWRPYVSRRLNRRSLNGGGFRSLATA